MKANFRRPKYTPGDVEPFLLFPVTNEWESDNINTLGESWHEDLEIVFSVSRAVFHYIDGKPYSVTPGMMVVTNAGSLHGFITDKKTEEKLKPEDCVQIEGMEEEIGALVILLSPQFMDRNFPRYNEMFFTNERLYPSEEALNILKELCRCAYDDPGNEFLKIHRKALILDLVYRLCYEGQVIAKTEDSIPDAKNLQRIKSILSYVEENYDKQITQEMVSKRFYFTPSYFSRYFYKYVGENFSDYLRKFRVSKAKDMLLTTDFSVAEIAIKCGFYDDRRFIIAFKKIHGDTPLQYKKKHNY